MTRFLKICSALLLTLAAAGAQAVNYAGTTFEIEMIVFERPQGMAQARETWPAAPRLQYPNRWVDFDTAEGEQLVLSPVATRLDNKAAALTRGGDRVLFHKAWQQVLQQKRRSPAILISGGDSIDGHRRLEGSVTVSVSRYLHLSTDLWLSEFGPSQSENGILLPRRPQARSEEPMELTVTSGEFTPTTAGGFFAETPAPVYAQRVAQLQQERRMRSGELHYLDHPAFGILIEIRTVAPEEEQDAGE
ncbi:Peptidoglycan-binding protein, CsiV [Microbulbifer donghaiensis]|uniref:Peptidoglycan-binding protein, CsiV n=1 Tax=Microbulbifer donghaiensis TaxID=494016 RepID=A0A1M4U372_9GAMM|nr:CsiV family protein [Microbulbifer donghaiensis]SHE51080.1 Peptidoglycan-binding protein, CsiV [Microbulbifer donghaiensis]